MIISHSWKKRSFKIKFTLRLLSSINKPNKCIGKTFEMIFMNKSSLFIAQKIYEISVPCLERNWISSRFRNSHTANEIPKTSTFRFVKLSSLDTVEQLFSI